MISLNDARRLLGAAAKSLSDEEILSQRDALRELAEIALETRAERIQHRLLQNTPE